MAQRILPIFFCVVVLVTTATVARDHLPNVEQGQIYSDGLSQAYEDDRFFFIAKDTVFDPDSGSSGGYLSEEDTTVEQEKLPDGKSEIGNDVAEDDDNNNNNNNEDSHVPASPFMRDNGNIFAFQELANLLQLVQRGQSFATSNGVNENGGAAVASSEASPTTCLPDDCQHFNNDVETALQYLPRLNPSPTLTNLLFSSCGSSRSLVDCFKRDEQKAACSEASKRATWAAIELRHSHLCNTSTLLGQCITAIEVSPAQRYCVVKAITNAADIKNANGASLKQTDSAFDLCVALNNFLNCSLLGASVCVASSRSLSEQSEAGEHRLFLSQAFFALVHRFRQNKIYFAEFCRSLGMDANQLLVNYALLASHHNNDPKFQSPEGMANFCLPPTTTITSPTADNNKSSTANKRPDSLTTSPILAAAAGGGGVRSTVTSTLSNELNVKMVPDQDGTDYRQILRTSKNNNNNNNNNSLNLNSAASNWLASISIAPLVSSLLAFFIIVGENSTPSLFFIGGDTKLRHLAC